MSDKIYHIDSNGELHPMPETKFDNEDIFQALLEQHTELLVTGGETPRWLLVTREMPVADTTSGSDRWSLDHLFLDQNGVPTLVEVKRSTDTRLRREVVGQMLDYASNAVVHWSVDRIISELEKRCERDGTDPTEVVCKHLQLADDEDVDGAVEKFWATVKTNLDAEKLRLLFVADKIPSELQRIIEFLNNQMTPAEVLGVELKLFKTDQFQTLVPRVVGQTEKAQQRKSTYKSGPKMQWDEETLLAEIETNTDADTRAIAKNLLDCMRSLCEPTWGKGAKIGYAYLHQMYRGKKVHYINVHTDGKASISIDAFPDDPETQTMLKEFLRRLNEISGVDSLALDKMNWKEFPLQTFADPASRNKLQEAVKWLYAQIESDTDTQLS
jgi:hypothetical protein